MDHRISKDMISSGMIPSGEKKQEDLGKTQYGTVPSPNALSDVYKKMYETKEEVINEHHQKDKDGNTIPHEDEEIKEYAQLIPLATKLFGAGAGKAAAAGAGKAAVTTSGGKVMSGGAAKLSTMQKVGKAVKGVASNPMVQSQAMMSAGQPKGKTNKTSTISAGADLFDIVKGKLLDEGLSEEEIKDIMLTLTPDEIMNEMNGKRTSLDDYGSPEKRKAMKKAVEVSKEVNRYGGKTPDGTTAVDAQKGIENVRKSM